MGESQIGAEVNKLDNCSFEKSTVVDSSKSNQNIENETSIPIGKLNK
jgi:hypothetical protein